MSAIGYLSRNLFEPLYNSLQGLGEINTSVPHWRKLFVAPYDEVERLQTRLLCSALNRAYENVPYYTELFDKLGIAGRLEEPAAFKEIPLLDKPTIRSRPDDFLNTSIPREELLKTATGGSTSDPLVFYRDHHCYCQRWALQAAANVQLGWQPGEWYGMIWGAVQDLPTGDSLRNKMMNSLVYRRLVLDSSSLDEQLLTQFLVEVRKRKPKIIYGYPVMLEVVADTIMGMKFEVPPPDAVVVTAEKLTTRARASIEKAFSAPVIDRYASREFGIVADQVAGSESLRVAPGSIHVEVDPISKDDPSYGELILTDLLNSGMPMIRYRTGDVGRLQKTTINGREGLFLSDISGRTTDLIVTAKGELVSGTGASPFFDEYVGIDQVQIHQQAIDRFEAIVVPTPDYGSETERLIRETLEQYCGSEIELTFTKVERIPRDPSGKFRVFISDVAPTLFGVTGAPPDSHR